MFVLGVIVSIALTVAPATIGIIYSQRRIAWNKGFLARAVRVQGAVVDTPMGFTGGAEGVGGRLVTAPIVSYPGPNGDRLQARVKVATGSMYTYGQPVDVLVDPQNPSQIVLANHANDHLQSNAVAMMCIVLSFMTAGLVFLVWLSVALVGGFAWMAAQPAPR